MSKSKILIVSKCFEFSPFYVSVCFETIESVDSDIFSLFQYVSVSLLYNLYVSMFRNKFETLGHILYRLVANNLTI